MFAVLSVEGEWIVWRKLDCLLRCPSTAFCELLWLSVRSGERQSEEKKNQTDDSIMLSAFEQKHILLTLSLRSLWLEGGIWPNCDELLRE